MKRPIIEGGIFKGFADEDTGIVKTLLNFRDEKCKKFNVQYVCDACSYQDEDCHCLILKLINRIRREEQK